MAPLRKEGSSKPSKKLTGPAVGGTAFKQELVADAG